MEENMERKINDHDLLIELRSEMRNLRNDIQDLKNGTAKRIDDLETGKADLKSVEDLQRKVNIDIEERLRKLEEKNSSSNTFLVFLSGTAVLILGLLIWHLTGYKI